MEVAEAREALATIGLSPRRIEPVLGGWANFTFELDGCWMVRFPSNEGVAESTARELRLLPALGRFVDFVVPSPAATGAWRGWPFFTYRKLIGRPLSAADGSPAVRARLADILRQLHSFPLGRATELLGVDDARAVWRRRYEELWPMVESTALPELPAGLAEQVTAAYQEFVTTEFDFDPCLVHNDLFSDHVLVDDAGHVTGIIDFEDSCIGDPIIDFVPLVEALGSGVLKDLSAGRALGADLSLRFWFYRWMGGIHNIIYGASEGAQPELLSGIAEVRARMKEPRLSTALFRPSAVDP